MKDMDDVEKIIKERESKIKDLSSYLNHKFNIDSVSREFLAERILDSIETNKVTTAMIFTRFARNWVPSLIWVLVSLAVIGSASYGGYFAYYKYYENYYPFTVEISKNSRLQNREHGGCLIDKVCADKSLYDAINEDLNDLPDGKTIVLNNGYNELWEVSRRSNRFVIVVNKIK